MNLVVDTDKLEWGLEKGIGETRTFFSHLPPEKRLRDTSRGLVSAAITSYALREGIPSRLLITAPKLSIEPDMQHVVALIESDEDNPTILDGSISQFLGYAGITAAYEQYIAESLFPPEKILVFGLQDTRVAVDWLTKAVKSFRDNHPTIDLQGALIPREPLVDASIEDVVAVYESIYKPSNFHTWMPPHQVATAGYQASLSIPSGAIQIQ